MDFNVIKLQNSKHRIINEFRKYYIYKKPKYIAKNYRLKNIIQRL